MALTAALFVAALPALVTSMWSFSNTSSVGSGGRFHAVSSDTAPAPAAGMTLRPLTGYLTARLTSPTLVRATPGGRPIARLATRTKFGSPTVLGGLEQRGGWISVVAPELGNGRSGWIPARNASLVRLPYSLRLDLSRRQLVMTEGDRVLKRLTVAVGRPGTPTPTGRFSVTDKLRVTDPASPYGCCAIALSARQAQVPSGWPGGDRIAIHATHDLASIGQSASFGCVRGLPKDVKALMRAVPLGTPVFIRA
jgi:L,D-transpeptidase-like protein